MSEAPSKHMAERLRRIADGLSIIHSPMQRGELLRLAECFERPMDRDEAKALDEFSSLLKMIDALPRRVGSDEPLASHVPGVWPTVGNLRALVRLAREAS